MYAAVCDCKLPAVFLIWVERPVFDQPVPVNVPQVVAAGLPQKAMFIEFGAVLVMPVTEIAVPVGFAFAGAICLSQVVKPGLAALNTYMTTDIGRPLPPPVTDGSPPDQVPLKRHQKMRVRWLVPLYCPSLVHVWPPVAEIDKVLAVCR